MDLKPFLKSLFDSFVVELHSKNSKDLQDEIAKGFLTYFGQFKDGDIYILENEELSRLSPYELAEELPFKEKEIEEYLKYTKSISLNTHLLYNGMYIQPNTHWVIGGMSSIFDDLISGKITYFTFPIHVEFTPDIGVSYELSATIQNTSVDGLFIQVKPDYISKRDPKESTKKYTGYYASDDGSMDAQVVISKFNLNWCRANTLKYIIRAGKKDPNKEIEDLEKAKKYIDYDIERLKNLSCDK